MFLQFIRLQFLKNVRSVSLGRSLIGGIVLAILGFIILFNILVLGAGLPGLLEKITGRSDVTVVLNIILVFFFLMEMMYRFFLQKISAIDLENFLHLPIGRPKIINYLFFRSFLSPFNLVVILLFAPFYLLEVGPEYGFGWGFCWLLTIVLLSWSVHWLMLWFKQKMGDTVIGILALLAVFFIGAGAAWLGWFNIGIWVEPFFTTALQNPVPLIVSALIFIMTYLLSFFYYLNHAYLEELGSRDKNRLWGGGISLFSRFGMPGAVADMELKLILRHKKSRMFLLFSVLFLAYGLIFYGDDNMTGGAGVPWMAIFVGTFITGIFIMNYGQLYLSWNSPHFDFFLNRDNGIESLVRGKYLVFFGISTVCFILAIPYVYFGWTILLVHGVTFLFNIGINIHIIIAMALWNPKPMDLSRGSMFNYEGVGAAQFLMAIPMIGLPYLIFLPTAYWINDYVGLAILGTIGIIGVVFFEQFVDMQVNRILKNRYAISSSFRQEL